MKTSSQAVTHVGKVRTLNEDAWFGRDEDGLWAVADGMGGHDAGDMASRTIVETLAGFQPAARFADSRERLMSALQAANRSLAAETRHGAHFRQPGSTVVALLIQDGQGMVAWAGDSRAYRLRGDNLQQLTRDHSHVQDLLDNELIEHEDVEKHPMANVITRAVGIEVPVEIDTLEFRVEHGDRYLLCSDGLSRVLDDQSLARAVIDGEEGEVVPSLLEATLERGAPDNVTIVLVRCD